MPGVQLFRRTNEADGAPKLEFRFADGHNLKPSAGIRSANRRSQVSQKIHDTGANQYWLVCFLGDNGTVHLAYRRFTMHDPDSILYGLLGAIVVVMARAGWQLNWIKRHPFRRVDVTAQGRNCILKGGSSTRLVAQQSFLIFVVIFVLLAVFDSTKDTVGSPDWPRFFIWFVVVWLFLRWQGSKYKEWVELEDDKLIRVAQFKFSGKLKNLFKRNTETIRKESLYSNITRVESPGFSGLRIYYFQEDKQGQMDIERQDFGINGLATVLNAITRHAPQASFDAEADLMRRGYFSW